MLVRLLKQNKVFVSLVHHHGRHSFVLEHQHGAVTSCENAQHPSFNVYHKIQGIAGVAFRQTPSHGLFLILLHKNV